LLTRVPDALSSIRIAVACEELEKRRQFLPFFQRPCYHSVLQGTPRNRRQI